MKPLWALLLIAPAVMAAHDWAHYQMIVARAPFGQEPSPEAETAAQPPGALASEYRLCMLYEDGEGRLKAGLVSKVNDKSLLLEAGETSGNIELMEVRLADGKVLLRRGDETVELVLEKLRPAGLSSQEMLSASSAAGGAASSGLVSYHTGGSLADTVRPGQTVLIGRPRVALKKQTPAVSGSAGEGRRPGEEAAAEREAAGGADGADQEQMADRIAKRDRIMSRPFSFQRAEGRPQF